MIEYPVVGYVPPAILTEMHFDVRHSTFDALPAAADAHVAAAVGRITLALGSVKVNCSLLDTGKDASITVLLEDVGVYVAAPANTPNLINDSVCVCDLDLLEVAVNLRDQGPQVGGIT